jgi:ssDNA-binding Zn-finger/Zn-ribbon topoisomerase 1
MPALQLSFPFAANRIEGRPCPECRSPMVLARIKPARLGFDACAFECVRCNNVENVMVEANARIRPRWFA